MNNLDFDNASSCKKVFKRYSLLVNSTDSFEDCWLPFFKLFKIYWPNFNGTIYLNTELKTFEYQELNINAILNNKSDFKEKITWSECLIRALQSIDDEIVLYMQDDYFIKAAVDNSIVEKYVDLIYSNVEIDCIHLTDQAVIPSFKSTHEGLYQVRVKQRYRISCQAALWRKSVLLQYLRKNENAWQFEEFGSQRSPYYNHNFFVVDPKWVEIGRYEIIPYIFTGIIQGKWNEKVVSLFNEKAIDINFYKRGFYRRDKRRKSFKDKVIYQLNRIPVLVTHKIEIFKLLLLS